jgi:hypothetical protein
MIMKSQALNLTRGGSMKLENTKLEPELEVVGGSTKLK